jgi:membrane protease YdiL (CAAX protease family)
MERMSGYAKGTRKPKKGVGLKEIKVGGFKIKPAVAIASLMAALYVVFLIGVKLESGLDALILSIFSFTMFAALAYAVRSGSLAGLKPFTLLIDAFLALSSLSLVQAFAGFMSIFGPATDIAIQRLAFMMTANAAIAAILLIAVLYLEKEGRENIYLKASPLRSALMGFALMAACGLVAIGSAYYILNGVATKNGPFLLTALNILVFGLFGGVYEEALFRGLLLSRLRQVLRENYALAAQAIVFSVFEALAVYAFMPNVLVLPIVLVAGALLGYFFGMVTLKNESILAPQLIHAGLYMLLAIPLFMA